MLMRLLAKSSAFALAAALAPTLANAQSAVDVLRDEILVTGTKKGATDVQDTPIAVTAYGADQLDALRVRDLQSLTYSIPNVQLDDIGTTPGVANFSIRGLGINSSIPSIDPTVGVFVDGMYLGINNGVVLDMFDLESIEVLRGPQGIQFGRNVTGGAVLINTKKAPDEFTAEFKTAVESGFRGTGNNYYAMGSVGGPLIEGVLNAKVAVYYNNDRGWQNRYDGGTNLVTQVLAGGGTLAALQGLGFPIATVRTDTFQNFGKAETFIIRPSILFRPAENFEINVRYERGSSEGDGAGAQNHTNGLGQTNPFFSASRDSFDFSIDEVGFYDNRWDQVVAEANLGVGFGDGTITYIFGWREFEAATRGDIDATPLWLFHSDAFVDQDQISNELRYTGRFGRLGVTTGFYHFNQSIGYDEQRFLLGGFRNLFGGGVQDQTTYGVFAEVDLDLTDRLTFTVGGRYTFEKKDVVIANLNLNTTICSSIAGTCFADFIDDDRWENFNPKVGLQFAASDDLNLYGHWTQGVRSGGYNFRNTAVASAPQLPNPAPPPAFVPNPAFNPQFLPGPFDEETVNAFEIGAKANIGNRARLNTAVYLNKIKDMQRELNLADPIAGVVQVILNTADATIWGFEMEGQWAPTDNLLLTGFVGHTNGSYDTVLFDIGSPNPAGSPGVVDAADLALEIPRLSPWTYGVGAILSKDMGSLGAGTARVNFSHRDRNFYTDNNLGVLNAVDSLDFALTLSTFGSKTDISLYGKNMLNEVNFGGDTQLPASLGAGTFSPLTRGRTLGIELQVRL